MWLVSKHEDRDNTTQAKTYVQKLHGLYTTTLTEVPGSPLTIPTTGGFDPNAQNQRAGLALFDNPPGYANVVVAWGSHCDTSGTTNYSGFVMEFDYYYGGTPPGFTTGTDVFNTETGGGGPTPQGGIWMAGGAPAIGGGGIFFAVGNGYAGATGQYGESVVKLGPEMALTASYTTNDASVLNLGGDSVNCGPTHPTFCDSNNRIALNSGDWDLGSGGVVLLTPTPAPSGGAELTAAGKQGMLYVLKESLSGAAVDGSAYKDFACDTSTNNASVVQCFQAIALGSNTGSKPDWGNRATPAFWGASSENFLYMAGIGDVLNAYQMNNDGSGTFNTTPKWSSAHTWGSIGASPIVTWNSGGATGDAIVWALDNHQYGNISPGGKVNPAGPTQLFAYSTTSNTSGVSPIAQTSGSSTTMPGAVKFVVPTVVDGKIFIGGGSPGYTINSGSCQAPWTGTTFQCGQLTILQ